jgi:CTP:molybdopterin cytidylyltransferase MocA
MDAADADAASRLDTVAVVLAAGAGRRFAGPTHKLDAELDGRPLILHALAAAVASAVGPVLVVVSDQTTTPLPSGVTPVVNPEWRRGQMSSLHAGLAAAAELGAAAAVVGLADQPLVTPDAWRRVAAADAPIAVATYSGRRGNPVKLRRDVWQLLPPNGDEGARSLMRLRPDLVVAVPCQGSPIDVDTVEDLRRWQNSSSTSSP